jgi:hypothetical protein
MATLLVDETAREGVMSPRAVSEGRRRTDRTDSLWTLFGAALLLTFLSYVALTGA